MMLTSKSKSLNLESPRVMGILNVTPDSFSDGGRYKHLDSAQQQALAMIDAGVSIIDIGGESTRPGASAVSTDEELSRVIPIIGRIREHSDIWISIDTSKAEVMKEAVNAGADLINDVRALQEPNALSVAAQLQVPVCLMHMQGAPATMQANPSYEDLFKEITFFLNERITQCEQHGLARENIIIDPGFGFGKTVEQNYQLLAKFEYFHQLGLPLLAGMSRKSMIFKLLDKKPTDILAGSLACATIAAMKGAQIIRVHDVEETVEVVRICQMTQQFQLEQ